MKIIEICEENNIKITLWIVVHSSSGKMLIK